MASLQGESTFEAVETSNGITESLMEITLVMMLFALFLLIIHLKHNPQRHQLPPGPPSLPIIGNLHVLGELPHRALHNLSRKYGPVMFLRLGSVPTVVASSPHVAEQFLKTDDLAFASRPATIAGKYIVYDSTDVVLAPYGPHWREMRKICALQFLSTKQIKSSDFIRAEVISEMIRSISEHITLKGSSHPLNVSKTVHSLAINIICKTAFREIFSEEMFDGTGGFEAALRELEFLVGAFNVGDFIPWLRWMDVQGLGRRMKSIHKTFDDFFEKVLEEHMKRRNDLHKDFVDDLLAIAEDSSAEITLSRDNIKALLLDVLAAGTTTTSLTMEWAMSELLKNPSVMKKVQQELATVIRPKRKAEECDLPRLEYLKAVVKETMRLHPVLPLLIPHQSMDNCNVCVDGYRIPSRARIIVNVWALGRDPHSWEDAEQFKPERFIGSSIDVRGQNFELIPFGSGRRKCPGINLAMDVVELALAQLLHCFDWRLPNGMNGEALDMSERFGLTVGRAVHLHAVPIPRLS